MARLALLNADQIGIRYKWDKKRGTAYRPWRLYGTKPNGQHAAIPWRSFADEVRAHNAAMIDVRWGEWKTLEVYDVRNGKESGTYKMHASGQIGFSAPEDSNVVKILVKKGVING